MLMMGGSIFNKEPMTRRVTHYVDYCMTYSFTVAYRRDCYFILFMYLFIIY